MAINWYYAEAGQKHGPVSSSKLRDLAAAGTIKPETLVWKDGLSEWVPALRIQGLFPVDSPPPPPPIHASPPQEPNSPPTQEERLFPDVDIEEPMKILVEKAKAGDFSRGALMVFYGWTAFCCFGVFTGIFSAASDYRPSYTEAGRAGQAIGLGCGMMVWFIVWAAIAAPAFFIWYKGQKK